MDIMYKDKSVSPFKCLEVGDIFEANLGLNEKNPFMKIKPYCNMNAISLDNAQVYCFQDFEVVVRLKGTLNVEYA